MLGKKVDLGWLDTGTFEHVRGSMDGWRTAKVLIIEFWASYVHHLAFPAASRARAQTRRRPALRKREAGMTREAGSSSRPAAGSGRVPRGGHYKRVPRDRYPSATCAPVRPARVSRLRVGVRLWPRDPCRARGAG